MTSSAGESASTFVDYYKELNIDRDLSVSELQTKIQELKAQWGMRAALVGRRGEEARKVLSLLDDAAQVFADEDSKDRYDRDLRSHGTTEDEENVNWVQRAWTYYFAKDYGPASVAARKARQHNSDDPTAYVVSAWIELAELEVKKAEEYASEAYVLDELSEDTFDVHEVRGATFHNSSKFERAIEAFNRALTRAPEVMKPSIYWRLSLSQRALQHHDDALTSCLLGLSNEAYPLIDEVGSDLISSARQTICGLCISNKSLNQDLSLLEKTRVRIENSKASRDAKQDLTAFVDKLIEITNLKYRTNKTPEPPKDSDKPDFPLISAGAAAFFLIIFISFPHIITFLLFAVPGALVGYWLYQKSEFKKTVSEYEDALARYNQDKNRIKKLSAEISQIEKNLKVSSDGEIRLF
ncbi:hypothetical protein [Schaalia cardiffensis]|uniref:tetratricopeptide repeat protein n=1 Tax=Schaalia cardiffensis TaxID=181487 RepID=UPI002AB14E5A|nr:hypothetical protein [Schaalia cardiffensis]